jgi:hypothetical protein
MIFKRYGSSYHSVDPHFESTALNEVGFRRDRERSLSADELDAAYERLTTHELAAEADGLVQDHTEQLLLDRIESRLLELEASLEEHCILVVDNGDGRDWPKARQRIRNVVIDGENRLHFEYTVSPPLRMAVYGRRSRATE